MQTAADESFQIATLVVVVLIVLVCMGITVIFVNPQVALNPLKPPLPTTTLVIAALPPTWTPTPTDTPTFTPTPTSTDTPTLTPTSTPTPTPTLVPASATPLATPTRTRPPATRTPRPPPPSPWSYFAAFRGCNHSGGTYIEGRVTNSGGEESGVRVARGSSPGNVEETRTSGSGERSPGYYTFVLNANGSRPGTWYVWIVDAGGKALSDPNAARIVTNDIRNGDDPNSCWQAFVDFARR